MISVMLLVWAMAIMLYFDRYIPPFNRLAQKVLPWKMLSSIPSDVLLPERLAIMQEILDRSNNLSNSALITMIASFTLFSVYLTFVYQQRQRRTQENRLLILKNQEIARRNEFIRYISATIGHEFKNTLGRIKRRLDLMTDFPFETKAIIDDNFDKLFADIAIFKKISDERESGLITFKEIDLVKMIKTVSSRYADSAEIRFEDSPELPSPVIFASETLLKTVFETLFDNAIKYKKPEQDRARVILSFSVDVDGGRRYISVSFRDEGTGMDEKQATRCCYKGTVTAEGWGQGLYFAKYVVGLHAGRIKVGKGYTKEGLGTEIIVNLPFVEETLNV